MFEGIMKIFNKMIKKEEKVVSNSKDAAKERLHLVLMQDRANVSADFLELMKQEIIEVIKKYIDIDEGAIDVRLTNKENEDGTNGAPALYANIPIKNIKNEARKIEKQDNKEESNNKKEIKNKEESNKKEKDKEESNKEESNKNEIEENNKQEIVEETNTKENKQEEKDIKNTKTEEKLKEEDNNKIKSN